MSRLPPLYSVGDIVTLTRCPDKGTVVDVRIGQAKNFYRMDWDAVPEDHRYYSEDQLVLWEGGTDAGPIEVGRL